MKPFVPGLANYLDYDRPEVAELIPAHCRRVLDVGCARGALGALILRNNPDRTVDGVEPNEAAAEIARSRLSSVRTGTFPDALSSETEPYDCIVFADVLEHMVDPWTALVEARARLSTEGIVVASIPNVRNVDVLFDLVFRGKFDYADFGILDRTHLRFFTRSSITQMFIDTGYEVDFITTFEHHSGRRPFQVARALGPLGRDFRALQFGVVARSK